MNIRMLVFAASAALQIGVGVKTASAQNIGSAITYQGMFADNGAPASGTYDFEFVLFSIASGGTAIETVTKPDVLVNGGLINTPIDFGAAAYDSQVKWIEVHVRPGTSSGAYTVLSPRQALTASPYAMGLVMPFQHTVSTGNATAFQISNTDSGTAIEGIVPSFSGNPAIHGTAHIGAGVEGSSSSADGLGVNGENTAGTGVRGFSGGPGDGVRGVSTTGVGIHGFGALWAGLFEGLLKVEGSVNCNVAGCPSVMNIRNDVIGNLILASAGTPSTDVFRVSGFGEVFANGGYEASGADLAEHVPSVARLEAGDVVEIDADNGGLFQRSSHSNSTAVAGVISTKPGVTLNGTESEKAPQDAMPRLALSGRVPVKATLENGAIHAGDLLVSSSKPGRAMRAPASPQPGTVIGKAMQKLDRASGEIEMLVMLR